MSVRNGIVTGMSVNASATSLMARIVGQSNLLLIPSALTSLAYVVSDLTANVIGEQQPLSPVSSYVFDTIQTPTIDPSWTEDTTGYNFKWTVPANLLSYTPTLDAQGNLIPHQWEVDVIFTATDGSQFVVPFVFILSPNYA